ncbi:hypothetical protein [Pedobacter sp. GR22-6]|uniref:hypothetical protein n=1 Tax=Pedobacter sp. GR22-6 TaxID=3127957 RepID=UPI00307F7E0F
MKKIGLTLIAGVMLFSNCSIKYKYPKFDFGNGPNPCLNAFKDKVFIAILRECYKGTDAMKEISKRDAGNPYDGIYSLEIFKAIDSIGIDFAKKIPPPSLCPECRPGENYFMAQALHFYRSHELDSIARAELKKEGFGFDCGIK